MAGQCNDLHPGLNTTTGKGWKPREVSMTAATNREPVRLSLPKHAWRLGLRVVFIPNYRVSLAERIIPAANLSEQISLAGTEVSGTGNMKFQLNGALTMGTYDGANIEILEEVGPENFFLSGMTSDEVARFRLTYNPREVCRENAEISRALRMIEEDFFSFFEPGIFRPILHSLLDGGDPCMLLADLASYAGAQHRADEAYRDTADWGTGKQSSTWPGPESVRRTAPFVNTPREFGGSARARSMDTGTPIDFLPDDENHRA